MNDTTQPIEVRGLTRRFRKKVALDRVDLSAARGRVLGLVGENGAGKTTLLLHLLGLLRAQEGTVRVFGMDPVRAPDRVLAKIGYLSENRELPPWMRVRELLLYTKAFYPKWDDAFAQELIETFGLDLEAKIGHLSRGQMAQAGLVVALSYRPELLLLDEPSSGLDPVVRQDILTAIIRTVADEGRTVLFSSHLLEEVERVADDVAMIHEGKLAFCAPMDDIRERHRRITVRLPEPASAAPGFPGVLHWRRALGVAASREWTAVCDGHADEFKRAAAEARVEILEDASASLEEVFVARVKGRRS